MYIGEVTLPMEALIVESRETNLWITKDNRITESSYRLLCDSLAEDGQWFPIAVHSNLDGTYRVLIGNRRVHAMALMKWKQVRAFLYVGLSDEEIERMTYKTKCFCFHE